ncbi:MAG: hypothetical protein KJ620_02030 [Candidatus Edwardsbacteria bacterium]|nr:hypothetical protein [Candidatus Edwardsbacteria bacterium]MBU1576663.1 hypothetical protein [Candidatus Edwardsbacteria bacterium]MBU2464411.1 hypothetical protein [Candidatus Edwardsbacteria bacterium]MBU2594491.1 hypothetical protein [Candidatus Edwardsbacteria bacterium]
MKRIYSIVLLILFACPGFAMVVPGLDLLKRVLDRFEFMPEYHMVGDVMAFANHKDIEYRRRYFIETNSDLEFVFFSYRGLIYSDWFLYMKTGMGRQDGAVIFDPRDVRYGITPSLEIRLKRANLRAGLEHFCFHDIDRNDGVTEYWNKEFLEVFSKNYRLGEYRRRLIGENSWAPGNRFSNNTRLGLYIKRAFGLLPEAVLGGGHNYRWELTQENRWAFFRSHDWMVNIKSLANANVRRDGRVLQTYVLGLEGHFRRGAGGSMLFLNYNLLDQLEVRPKDKLLEAGIRFYN